MKVLYADIMPKTWEGACLTNRHPNLLKEKPPC